MLTLLEERPEKIRAVELLTSMLKSSWREYEKRLVAWRPHSREMQLTHNNRLWFVSVKPDASQGIKRYWNSFGIFNETGNLEISVEINVPVDINTSMVSGFFARDSITRTVYLLHDGGVGGGQKGIGQKAFLSWSGLAPVSVQDSKGRIRLGLIVTALIKGEVDSSVSRFVNRVAKFKSAVRSGEVAVSGEKTESSYVDYYKEFSGKKKGQRRRELEYLSRHGDVVDELAAWASRYGQTGDRLVKNAYIDLGIELRGRLIALFEVKTCTGRQNLYTAIGQLTVHGSRDRGLKRYVVVPSDGVIPNDIRTCLRKVEIELLTYRIMGDEVTILKS